MRTQTIQSRPYWVTGKINLVAVARKLGYTGAALFSGVRKVRKLLLQMGITVL